jgi:hypothetical protein
MLVLARVSTDRGTKLGVEHGINDWLKDLGGMSRRAESALYRLLKLPCYRLQCGQQGMLFGFEIEINNTR